MGSDILFKELIDENFSADEFLNSYIAHRGLISRPEQSADLEISLSFLKLAKPNGKDPADNTTINLDVPFADNHNVCYDTSRLRTCLKHLLDTCRFVHARAEGQQKRAELVLAEVAKEAAQQLSIRGEKVRRNLHTTEEVILALDTLTHVIADVSVRIKGVVAPQDHLLEVHKYLTYFVELNVEAVGGGGGGDTMTYQELLQERVVLEDYQKAAGCVLGLHKIAEALVVYQDDVYLKARHRIAGLYREMESDLVRLFARGQDAEPRDLNLMLEMASLLQHFPQAYTLAISSFVDHAVRLVPHTSPDPFQHIVQVCEATNNLIYEVFPGRFSVIRKVKETFFYVQ